MLTALLNTQLADEDTLLALRYVRGAYSLGLHIPHKLHYYHELDYHKSYSNQV